MVKEMYVVRCIDKKRVMDFMYMLSLNEALDQLAKTDNV